MAQESQIALETNLIFNQISPYFSEYKLNNIVKNKEKTWLNIKFVTDPK